MARDKNEQPDKLDAGERIDRELSRSVSNLWGKLAANSESAVTSVYLRGGGSGRWLAVAKRVGPVGHLRQVAFGEGATVGAALHALNTAIMQDRWREDRPWRGPQ